MTFTCSRLGACLAARRFMPLSWAAAFLLAAAVLPAAAQVKEESIVLTDELVQSPTAHGAHDKVLRWLREVIDPNSVQDGVGNTVMHYVATNTLEILATAIARGGDCNRRNAHGASPLHFAAAQARRAGSVPDPRSIRLLVECGAEPDLRDRRGAAPLHAVYLGVERGAFPIWGLEIFGGVRVEVLKALLEAGADPGIRDGNGDTPLILAVKENSTAIELSPRRDHLRLLVEHGADPDGRDEAGATPLILAVTSHADARGDKAESIVKTLIGLGADPDLRDRAGDTALIRAAKIGEYDSVAPIRALLAGGADPCLADRAGKLPYDHAAEGSAQRELLDKAGGGRDWKTGLCVREVRAVAEAEKKLGLDKEARARIQSCLASAGFDPGPADGAFGSRTRAALRKWQEKQGRKGAAATGYLTEADAAALQDCKSAPTPVCDGKAGAACWMEVENRPGCYLWNPNPQPEETVTWSGTCVDGKASGKGVSFWRFRKDGESKTSSQEGTRRDGKLAGGHVIFRQTDGNVWEGPLAEDGKDHGLWVRRGSGGRDHQCWRNGKRVDDGVCVSGDDRSMQAVRAAAVSSGPSTDYERVGRLEAGAKVKVTGSRADGWMRVALPDGNVGFVRAQVLEASKLSHDVVLTQAQAGFSDEDLAQAELSDEVLAQVDEIFAKANNFVGCCYFFEGQRRIVGWHGRPREIGNTWQNRWEASWNTIYKTALDIIQEKGTRKEDWGGISGSKFPWSNFEKVRGTDERGSYSETHYLGFYKHSLIIFQGRTWPSLQSARSRSLSIGFSPNTNPDITTSTSWSGYAAGWQNPIFKPDPWQNNPKEEQLSTRESAIRGSVTIEIPDPSKPRVNIKFPNLSRPGFTYPEFTFENVLIVNGRSHTGYSYEEVEAMEHKFFVHRVNGKRPRSGTRFIANPDVIIDGPAASVDTHHGGLVLTFYGEDHNEVGGEFSFILPRPPIKGFPEMNFHVVFIAKKDAKQPAGQ